MTSSDTLDRAGLCVVCGCMVQQHFHPFTNVYRSCAYALRLNEQLRQSGAQPSGEPQRQFQVIAGGRDGDRQDGVR